MEEPSRLKLKQKYCSVTFMKVNSNTSVLYVCSVKFTDVRREILYLYFQALSFLWAVYIVYLTVRRFEPCLTGHSSGYILDVTIYCNNETTERRVKKMKHRFKLNKTECLRLS